jgi:hypothetical protein
MIASARRSRRLLRRRRERGVWLFMQNPPTGVTQRAVATCSIQR